MLRVVDDQRVGAAVRALRRRKGWRQTDLSASASVPQSTISEIEGGHLDVVPLRTLRAVFVALDVRGDIELRWRGGALDRLLDQRHAHLVDHVLRAITSAGWVAVPEVTYSAYGERGSIDVAAVRPDRQAALVIEVKSDIAAVEATNRQFDPKIRLAPGIIRERFGFTPAVLGAVLVLPDDRTARRRVADHAATFDARYPGRTLDVRTWLRSPDRALRAIWFLSDIAPDDPRRRSGSPTRVVVSRVGRGVPAQSASAAMHRG